MTAEPPSPPVRRGRAWTLRTRVTLLAVAVAVLVAVVSGLLSIQFVRSSLEDQARERLSATLREVTGGEVTGGDIDEVIERLQADGVLWAVVSPTGVTWGPAAEFVDTAATRSLRAGDAVSETRYKGLAPVVVEGAPFLGGGVVLATAEEEIAAASRALVLRIVAASAIGVVVAAVAGAWLAARISGPLSRTARGAARIARGDREVEMARSAIPEVAAIAEALAALDRSLAVSEGRQREFLLSISHELRTPLTALRGYAEGLADGTFRGEAVPRAGAILETETARLHRFVDDLLELARLEAQDFSLDIRPVAPADVLSAACEAWRAAASRDRIRIDLLIDPGAAERRIGTDARRLRQLVDGLVENALRVAPADSILTVALSGEDPPTISVRDRGPGLTDDDLQRVFDRTTLAERYRGSRPVGSGLGLSIADRLAGRMNLRLEASRPADGVGTLMTIRLPQPTSALDADAEAR
jgi:two-component system, OmpR family, sensor kinase